MRSVLAATLHVNGSHLHPTCDWLELNFKLFEGLLILMETIHRLFGVCLKFMARLEFKAGVGIPFFSWYSEPNCILHNNRRLISTRENKPSYRLTFRHQLTSLLPQFAAVLNRYVAPLLKLECWIDTEFFPGSFSEGFRPAHFPRIPFLLECTVALGTTKSEHLAKQNADPHSVIILLRLFLDAFNRSGMPDKYE